MSTIKVKVEGAEQGQEKKKKWTPLVLFIGTKPNDHWVSGIEWDYGGKEKLERQGYTNIITITAQRED